MGQKHAWKLTAEQDAASVTPAAFIRYLPAGQRVHAAVLVPEYCPAGHYAGVYKEFQNIENIDMLG